MFLILTNKKGGNVNGKKTKELYKYILTAFFLLLPTPTYYIKFGKGDEYLQTITSNYWHSAAVILLYFSLYILLTIFIVSVADNVKYWVISGILTTVLLCVGCIITPRFFETIVEPSFPLSEGRTMLLISWSIADAPAVLKTAVWGAEKVVFGALYMIVYKLVNKLKNKQCAVKLKKEFIIFGIASVFSSLMVAAYCSFDYISSADTLNIIDVFSIIISPVACLIIIVFLLKIFTLILLSYSIGADKLILVGCFVSLLLSAFFATDFFVCRKIKNKPKIVFVIKTVGTIVLFCLYSFVVFCLF